MSISTKLGENNRLRKGDKRKKGTVQGHSVVLISDMVKTLVINYFVINNYYKMVKILIISKVILNHGLLRMVL